MYPQYVHSGICDTYVHEVHICDICTWFAVTLWCNFSIPHRCIVNWSGGICILSICAFCDICNWFAVTLFHRCVVNRSLGHKCILSICVLGYMWHLFGVTVFHRCIVNWSGGYIYPQYMCNLLYVIVIWCNGISQIYCQLEWGM